MSRGPRLVLLGKQGAGKGTQSARLSERYGVEHVSTGDLFRRTLQQAEKLEEVLDGHPLDLVINLDVPTEIVLDRIAGRRVCESCGATYHVHAPPESDWTCDVCGGAVVQREDDTEDAVMRRLELYEEETVPIIDFYRNVGTLVVVDGTGDGDDVFTRLVAQVDQRLKPLQT